MQALYEFHLVLALGNLVWPLDHIHLDVIYHKNIKFLEYPETSLRRFENS